MKKKILMFAAILFCCTSVNAQSQDYKHEISLSYGWMSNSDWINIWEEVIKAPFTGKQERKNEKYFGPIAGEYFYRVSPLVAVGGIASFGHFSYDLYEKKDEGSQPRGEVTNNYITVLPAVKFNWLHKNNFGLYSKLGVGATFRSEKDDDINHSESDVHVNWQVSVVGVEAGANHVFGFAELGFGEQGVFLAGIRFRL